MGDRAALLAAAAEEAYAEDAALELLTPPSLFLQLRESHAEHGLRHGDYARYRKYCAARLHRLHQALSFLHASGPKGRFVRRELAAPDVTDARCVFLGPACGQG